MILATRRGNSELRMAGEWGSDHIIPAPHSSFISRAGVVVTETEAYGVPAVSNVIRSPAEIIASMPFFVYKDGPVRERADTSWQWSLLHDQPAPELSSYDFWYDVALSLEAVGNAFIRKIRGRGRLLALEVLDPHRVTVERDKETGEKRFDVYIDAGQIVRGLTTLDVLHIRGFCPNPGAVCGVSLLHLHRDPIGAQIAMQRFEGDYFRNSAQSPVVITGAANPDHAEGLGRAWNSAHAGAGNQWKTAAFWGQIDVKTLPVSLNDAMFADAKKLSIEDACRIWRWPKELLELGSDMEFSDEAAWSGRFLKYYLLPRLRRIERALAADSDLFGTSALYGEFLTAALERADYTTRVRGYKDARQGGWVTANEIRALENLPPLDGGDELQITPVGGAPNADSDTDSEETNESPE